MRLFIAIPVKNLVEIRSLQELVKAQIKYSRVKWVEPENFHLTLKFIGETQKFYTNSINMIISEINEKYTLPNIKLTCIGYFGSRNRISTLVLKADKENNLLKLQNELEVRLEDLGFEKSKHEYTPHLTLGRIKQYNPGDNFKEICNKIPFENIFFNIENPVLYKSTLTEKGPVYERLSY